MVTPRCIDGVRNNTQGREHDRVGEVQTGIAEVSDEHLDVAVRWVPDPPVEPFPQKRRPLIRTIASKSFTSTPLKRAGRQRRDPQRDGGELVEVGYDVAEGGVVGPVNIPRKKQGLIIGRTFDKATGSNEGVGGVLIREEVTALKNPCKRPRECRRLPEGTPRQV